MYKKIKTKAILVQLFVLLFVATFGYLTQSPVKTTVSAAVASCSEAAVSEQQDCNRRLTECNRFGAEDAPGCRQGVLNSYEPGPSGVESCSEVGESERENCNRRLTECNRFGFEDAPACREAVLNSYSPGQESGDTPAVPQATLDCETDGQCCEGDQLNADNCVIVNYIVTFTRVLSGIVGLVVVIMIAVGGVQYTTARDDPQAVNAARTRIRNAIMALVFYLLSVAFLQYLVPGGIF